MSADLAAALGRRVSVRRQVGEDAGRPVYGDVVGRLLAQAQGELFVLRRTGEVTVVRSCELLAGKVVPELPAERAGAEQAWATEVDALERIALDCWPARETEPLGAWLLRAFDGVTKRANSVAVIGEPDLPLDDALARVRAWYGARGLPALLQLPSGSPLDRRLAADGASRLSLALLETAPIPQVLAALAELGVDRDRFAPVATPDDGRSPTPAWLALSGPGPQQRRQILLAPEVVGLAGLPDPADPVAIGRVSVHGEWAGVTTVAVAPEARRRGLALQIMAGLLGWAVERGAARVFLQVESENTAARRLYERIGFTLHHPYAYRQLP